MAVVNINLTCELQEAVKVQYIDGVLFSQDNQANKINVTVLDGGQPATLSGTVSANIVRSDGGTVAATGGSITGNVASITLPSAAYAIPGVVSIVVKMTTSGVITTIAAIVGNMYRSSTDTAIDPGTIIPSIQTLISQINAAVASIPADYSSLWTKLAPAFSTDASYVAGQYVTYNSGLYRFNTTHTGDWSSSDVTAVNLGGEISDLKSAIVISKQTVTIPSASTTLYPRVDVKKGDWLRVINNTSVNFTVITCSNTAGSSDIQTLGTVSSGGGVLDKEITADAAYLRIWIGSSGVANEIFDVIKDGFGVIKLDDEMDNISRALGNYVYVETPTNITFAFPCTSGKKYVVKVLSGSIALYTRSTASGSNVQTIIPNGSGTAGTVKVFQPSNTTNYLRVESSASNSIIVGEYDGIAVLPYANEKGVSIAKETAVNGEKTTRDFLGEKIQFLPTKSKWSKGYWGADKTITVNNSYRAYSAYAFPAGTYYLNNYAEWQSFVENINTGDMTAIHYIQEASGDAYKFTVDYPFNVYISSSQVNTESMFANAALPSEYVFGVYPVKSEQYIIHVEKDGSGDFDTLVDAINFATQYMDSIVYVGSGTWDIIDELGSTYIESVSDTKRGLVLKNRIHIIFASNSKVTCNYTGSRSTTKQWLSAFNSGAYGFTLENARIYSDNIRYTVHDERDQDTDAYRNVYKNCKMIHSNGYYGQCIGGGLGTNGEVIIEDCYFNNTTSENWRDVVSYHNTAGSGRSFVDVNGCYFEGNHGVRFSWYGESPETDKSTMLVHGNSFGRENGTINNSAEGGATIENTEIIAYNNEFRN